MPPPQNLQGKRMGSAGDPMGCNTAWEGMRVLTNTQVLPLVWTQPHLLAISSSEKDRDSLPVECLGAAREGRSREQKNAAG